MHLWFKYREKILFFLLPPSSISLGGLGPTSPIFHPNGTVYFYLSRKISIKSSKMDHPREGSSRVAGEAGCGEYGS